MLPDDIAPRSALTASLCALGIAAALSGCTAGPDFKAPTALPPPRATVVAASALPGQAAPTPAWWQGFGDGTLDALEKQVLSGNLDLAEAGTRIGRARAALRIAGAAGLPQAGAGASYQRERASPKGILSLTGSGSPANEDAGGTAAFGSTTLPASNSSEYDLFQAGVDASWELDLWGKARRLREGSRALAQAAWFDREALQVSLSAEVARTYLHLRATEAQLAILRDNRAAVEQGQRIAEKRLDRGATTRFDAATAGTQLAAIDAQLPALERAAAQARNALALLAGLEPHALDSMLASPARTLPEIAAAPPPILPSDLARRRPDILAAEASLHAATADIGSAKADFYPSVSLGGSLGFQALNLSNLPLWDARQFVLGPILRLPIFQGGRLAGQLDLAKANQQAAAIHYRATVLRAWHEIDDAIEEVRTSEAQMAAAKTGVDQSRVAAHVAQRRYQAGATGYLAVLIAQRARLDREADYVASRQAHNDALVALYKAIGGGWTPPAAPEHGA
ncbi:efflux transporter outer membrane subunit [Novosphingobium terrae]|uniref:efflux transporter outer membrane subunit n=1 Tax=Novosphingobium terrae TaxID=2726189 RepID=UPI0019823CE7|nr:efflux transporter outer membrane subunit [Novosphingobium terrae]